MKLKERKARPHQTGLDTNQPQGSLDNFDPISHPGLHFFNVLINNKIQNLRIHFFSSEKKFPCHLFKNISSVSKEICQVAHCDLRNPFKSLLKISRSKCAIL